MNSPTYRFIPAMFHAVMQRRKTQTRRVMTPVPAEGFEPEPGPCEIYEPAMEDRHGMLYPGPEVYGIYTEDQGWVAPFGKPGTVKPVVTTWAVHRSLDSFKPMEILEVGQSGIWFDDGVTPKPDWAGKSRPSMFFPSRLYHLAPQARCEVVKVERVQDISAADACAEGLDTVCYPGKGQEGGDWLGFRNYQFKTAHPRLGTVILDHLHRVMGYASPVDSFRTLWDSINERRGYGWQVNPLVFATTFELVQ
jgi:hypothetical protein